jgi:hypothetical protein
VLEVNIGDERHRRVRHDVRERSGSFAIRDRDTDDLTSCLRELANLTERGNRVPGIRGCHRLHDNGILATHFHIADMKHPSRSPRRNQGHS